MTKDILALFAVGVLLGWIIKRFLKHALTICFVVAVLIIGHGFNPAVAMTMHPASQHRYPRPDMVRRSEKVIRATALNLAEPELPSRKRIPGVVKVELTIDEMGHVIYTKALTGQAPLREAALIAARKSTFRPTLVNGVPMKVFGVLTYRFKPSSVTRNRNSDIERFVRNS